MEVFDSGLWKTVWRISSSGMSYISTYMWASTQSRSGWGLLVHNLSIEKPPFQMINMFTVEHVRLILKNWSYRELYTPLNSINVLYIRNRPGKGYFPSCFPSFFIL